MRVVIAIESSNTRGMGHLFRSFQYVDYLEEAGVEYVYLINDDKVARSMLDDREIRYRVVDYADNESNWERKLIDEFGDEDVPGIKVWFNDKYTTASEMAEHIKDAGIPFVCMDDVGPGAELADIYFAGMIYPTLKDKKIPGKKYFFGSEYVVLSKELDRYKRARKNVKKIAITMGGSDPNEVTEAVVSELKKYDHDVSVVIGPSYKKRDELERINDGRFDIHQNLDSLFAFLYDYDLVITGGGGTCCESAAMGLPAMIIANASHEVNTGRYMQELGAAVYLGDHNDWDKDYLSRIGELDIESMSKNGMKLFDTKATERIWKKIFTMI